MTFEEALQKAIETAPNEHVAAALQAIHEQVVPWLGSGGTVHTDSGDNGPPPPPPPKNPGN